VTEQALERLREVVAESGLVPEGSTGVGLLSGGPDSACVAAGLVAALGAASVTGLHLNYGLRPDSDEDEATCGELCSALGIEVRVKRPELPSGNVQALARNARYQAAERLRAELGADWIATGHTRTDLAETVLYRLATSPGRRALLGLPPRRGRVIRPLLALGRSDTRELAVAAGLPFREDPSNRDRRFARVRLREEVLPVLRELSPATEQNIAATWSELAEESEALEALAAEALDAAGAAGGAVRAIDLADLHPALRRLCLRVLAERVTGYAVPLSREKAELAWRLVAEPEGGQVDLGSGVELQCEAGMWRIAIVAYDAAEPEPARLPLPGSCRFGRWELRAELREGSVEPAGPELATLDAATLGGDLEVRAWREGDRMRPLGLGGSKSLQDLFTDRGVPRSLRHTLPVVTAGGEIAWVAGVAIGEPFRLRPDSSRVAVLTAGLVD
jgi:tRNA(Ile)-lysidine synthase